MSWTPQAREVLDRACDRYGGLDAWQSLRTIRLTLDSFTGGLPLLKGAGWTFPSPTAFEIAPHERRTRLLEYPEAGQAGVFENGDVWIERRDGTRVAESLGHRRTLPGGGLSGALGLRRWGPLDVVYFLGYALAHYHSLPFTLADARLLGMRTTGPAGARQDVLDVELPADLHTHCRRQQFHVDARGRIVRHDYHAEIAGVWARGAHFWRRETPVDGFPLALERLVYLRLGTLPVPVTALHAVFRSAAVEWAEGGPQRAQ